MNARWLVLPLLLVAATQAEAQCRRTWWGRDCRDDDHRRERRGARSAVEFGVRGGYDFSSDAGTAGAQLRVPLAAGLSVVPSADVWLTDSAVDWQANADLALRPRALGGLYGGGGAAFVRGSFGLDDDTETETGYNLFLGLAGREVASTRVKPFAEGRWTTVNDDTAFRLSLGIDVPVR